MTNEYNAVEKLHEKALKTAQRAYSSESNNDLDVFTKAHASVTKEVSMPYAHWVVKNAIFCEYSTTPENCMKWYVFETNTFYTDSELYDLYITKHLNK